MRLVLYCPRANHLKILGPICAEATRRGHDVLVVAPAGDVKGGDALIHARAELGGMVPVTDRWRLAEFAPEWALAVGLRTAPTLRRLTRRRGVRWCALDHCGDNLSYFIEDASATDNWDLTFTLAPEPAAFAAQAVQFEVGALPVGYPELDQIGTVIGDKAACRAKWNLPPTGLIVVVGTAARPAGMIRLRRWWFNQYRYWAVMRELRRWADMARATVVAKTRVKHNDPAWLPRYCDRIVGDVSFYPFTTLELLAAADLYVGFASAMAIEAAALGIPSVHLYGWPPEAAEWPSGRPFKEQFFMREGGLWNCPGSRSVACYGEDWRFRLHEAIDTVLMERGFKGPGLMRAACERWAGPLDGKASSRVLDALEGRR